MNIKKVDQEFINEMESKRVPSSDSLLQACSDNVAVFAEKMLDIRLYSWQVYALDRIIDSENQSKYFVMITSRQIGKTLGSAIVSLWSAVFNKFPGGVENNTKVGIISAGEVQAKKLLNEIKLLMKRGDIFMKETYGSDKVGENFFTALLDEDGANNRTTITFEPHNPSVHGDIVLAGSKAGSVVVSYNPGSTVLGETFSLIIVDEAGKAERITDDFFWDELKPTGDKRNARFMILSTPWQANGFFYRMVNPDGVFDDLEDVEVFGFDVTAIELEDPDDYKRRLKEIKQLEADGKTDTVQRAYYCRFVQGETSFFDPDKVYEVFNDIYKKHDTYNKPCDLGIDFGAQKSSQTVITISTFHEPSGTIYRLFDKVYDVKEDESIVEDIKELKKRFNIDRIVYDDADTGRFIYQEFHKLGWNAHPMTFRKDKVRLFSAMRGKINSGKAFSYVDNDLKTEMLALENNPKRSRTVIGAPPGYSDDRIDSWVCSCYFYLEEDEPSGFISLSEEDRSDNSFNKKLSRREKRRQRGGKLDRY